MANSPLLTSRLDFLSAELLPKEDNLLEILVAMVTRTQRRSFQVNIDRFSVDVMDSDVRRRLDNPEGESGDDILGVMAALTVLPTANMRVAHRKKNPAAQRWERFWLRAGDNFTTIIAIAGFLLSVVGIIVSLK